MYLSKFKELLKNRFLEMIYVDLPTILALGILLFITFPILKYNELFIDYGLLLGMVLYIFFEKRYYRNK